ncbi:MAG: RagB/SusD family nutrient uptake outer membrane protein [Bacteroidota bacterium]|nr:RagB/SusD family nutrient uptake outer membrane protein [Bacteroidota bacterium]
MKHINKYLLILVASTIGLFSCADDLNISPTTILTDNQVFSNEPAVLAYLSVLYSNMPMEDFNYGTGMGSFHAFSYNKTAHCCGEALRTATGLMSDIGTGTSWGWWSGGYSAVRDVNNFIEKIPASTLPEDKKQMYLGEAMFIRGYIYFALAKRYGGVPIVTDVQTYDGDIAKLQVARNTEKEVYDYVSAQLDSAISLLPETSDRCRVNKYAAAALKSRAMLYAGSEAKYGSVQLNGLVGIPASFAKDYFEQAFKAADLVVSSKKYELYDKSTDKTENFTDMFLNDDPESNNEIILERDYSYPNICHSWDNLMLPYPVRGPQGYGSMICPTLDMVEQYEYIDGSDGALKITDQNGNPVHYAKPSDIYKDKDPRCMATITMPFSTFRGTEIGVQAGVVDDQAVSPSTTIYGHKAVTTGDPNSLYNPDTHQIDANGSISVIRIGGISSTTETSPTSFYLRKYLNFNADKSQATMWNSTQSWFDIRYAEVLLNYAEAAIEQSDEKDARFAVNQIRIRAGVAQLPSVTRDQVRHERTVELAFESHHYWDIRRWHIADQQILNRKFYALYPYYDVQTNDWIFTKVAVGYSYSFLPQMYYEKIPESQISADPKLVQNPLY